MNMGKAVEELDCGEKAKALAEAGDFDIAMYKFGAKPEYVPRFHSQAHPRCPPIAETHA
jgi:hypothetical protein